jgi:Protein of unknown function (DUF3795)
MDAMTAYCGLACNTCPIHLATLEMDKSRQQSMRSEIAKICTEQYGISLQIQDITDCDGCRTGARLFSGSANCEIRKCAVERKLESCAFCEEYACDKLLKHFEYDPDAKIRLENFRSSNF